MATKPRNLFDAGDLRLELQIRERIYKPRWQRMDRWLQMYLLYDYWQENKPLGQRRFISNEPQTIVDTCHRILSRFPIQWQCAIDQYSKTTEPEEDAYGSLERCLYGFMEDIDESLLNRMNMQARKHAAYQGLLRGKIACKVHITDKAERDSNVVYAQYDSRFVTETVDSMGLSTVIAQTPMTIDELCNEYPGVDPTKAGTGSNMGDATIVKTEIWDKQRMGVAALFGGNFVGWCIEPVEHGCFGEDGKREEGRLNRLPFIIRDVNGLAINEKPMASFYNGQVPGDSPAGLRRMAAAPQQEWRTTRRPVAERGRSILASIERHTPQFNEAVASIWQHFSLDTFGVYFMGTRSGTVPEDVSEGLGTGAVVGMERGDTVQRFNPLPMNESGLQFISIISEERQKGTIASVLQALGDYRSGFLQSRMEQTALNALEPFLSGQNSWASGVGQLIFDQYAYGGKTFNKKVRLSFTKEEGTGDKGFHVVEFDPAMLAERRPVVKGEVEPALPVDMMERANVASILVNGRRPLLSRSSAQERILKIPDPKRENERIWEDVAETDPVIVMDEIATALERLGKDEAAQLFRNRETAALAMEMMQIMQMQAMMGGQAANPQGTGGMGPGRGEQNMGGGGASIAPNALPPEATGQGDDGSSGGPQY